MKISQVSLRCRRIKHRFTTPDRLYRMLPLSRETDPRGLVSGVNSRDMTFDMTLLHARLTAICGVTPYSTIEVCLVIRMALALQ
jgi:hypothetical protein